MAVEPEQGAGTRARIKPQLEAQDFEFVERLWNTLMVVMRLVLAQRTSIARLRRMFGLASSIRWEKLATRYGSANIERAVDAALATCPGTGARASAPLPEAHEGQSHSVGALSLITASKRATLGEWRGTRALRCTLSSNSTATCWTQT